MFNFVNTVFVVGSISAFKYIAWKFLVALNQIGCGNSPWAKLHAAFKIKALKL